MSRLKGTGWLNQPRSSGRASAMQSFAIQSAPAPGGPQSHLSEAERAKSGRVSPAGTPLGQKLARQIGVEGHQGRRGAGSVVRDLQRVDVCSVSIAARFALDACRGGRRRPFRAGRND